MRLLASLALLLALATRVLGAACGITGTMDDVTYSWPCQQNFSGGINLLGASTVGYCWTATDTLGNGSWQMCASGGGAAAGANKQVQYNNAGTFGADPNFFYDAPSDTLTLDGTLNNLNVLDMDTGGVDINAAAGTATHSSATDATDTAQFSESLGKLTLQGPNAQFRFQWGLDSHSSDTRRKYYEDLNPYAAARRFSLVDAGASFNYAGEVISFSPEVNKWPGMLALFYSDNQTQPVLRYGGPSNSRRSTSGATNSMATPAFALFPLAGNTDYRNPGVHISPGGSGSPALTVHEIIETVAGPEVYNTKEVLTFPAASSCAAVARSVCTDTFNVNLTCTGAGTHLPYNGTAGGCGGGPCTSFNAESCGFTLGQRYFWAYVFDDVDGLDGDMRQTDVLSNDLYGEPTCLTRAAGVNGACINRGGTTASNMSFVDIPASDGTGRNYKYQIQLPLTCWAGATANENRCANTNTACATDSDCTAPAWCATLRKACAVNADCGAGGSCTVAPSSADRIRIYMGNPVSTSTTSYGDLLYLNTIVPTTCAADVDCGWGSAPGSCNAAGICVSTYVTDEAGFPAGPGPHCIGAGNPNGCCTGANTGSAGCRPNFHETEQLPSYNATSRRIMELFQRGTGNPLMALRQSSQHKDGIFWRFAGPSNNASILFASESTKKGVASYEIHDDGTSGGSHRFYTHTQVANDNWPTSKYLGLEVASDATNATVKIGGGTGIRKHLSGTASLTFAATPAGTCDSLSITVTGAADGDTVACGIPTALATADNYQSFQCFVSAANTVTVKRCNLLNTVTALSLPAAATVRADVWQH